MANCKRKVDSWQMGKMAKFCVLLSILAYLLGGVSTGLAAINLTAPVTANFQNTDIRDALQTLAAAGRARISLNTNVSAKVTAKFENTPFKDALQTLVSQARLVTRTEGDLVYVAMPGELPEQKAASSPSDVDGPQVIRLKYMKADQVRSALGGVVPEDRMRVEATQNALVFSGSPEEFMKLSKILAQLDVPPKQVMFEAELVEMDKSKVSEFGVKWQWSSYPSPSSSSLVGVLEVDKSKGYNLTYQATLNALVTSENAKILANPRVAVLDGQTANILIGDKLPVETKYISNGVQQVTVSYVSVGIKLEVTPWVNEDGVITTKLVPEVSTNIATSGSNPSIRTRQASTTLRVRDGETIVIGGLIQRETHRNVSKFPLLGDLPIVGRAFKSTSKEKIETELVIFITPKIINH